MAFGGGPVGFLGVSVCNEKRGKKIVVLRRGMVHSCCDENCEIEWQLVAWWIKDQSIGNDDDIKPNLAKILFVPQIR